MFSTIINSIKSSEIGMRIATGAFWSFSGTALAKFIVLVSGILCAHVLSKEEYGQFGMVRTTISMFAVLGSGSLGLTASKYISEFKNQKQHRISSIYNMANCFAFILGLIVVSIILLFAPYLASENLHSPELVDSLRIGAILLFVTVLNGAQGGTLSGLESFKSIAVNTLFGSIAESILMLVGAYYFGVFGAVLGYGSGYIVLYILNNIAIKRKFKDYNIKVVRYKIDKSDLPILYRFSLPAALCSLLVAPVIWITKSILVNNAGYAELAAYEVADQWRMIILFVPSAVSQIVLPILSSMSHGDNNKYWKVLRINLYLNAGVAFLISILVVILGPFIMTLYGSDYSSDSNVLTVLAVSTIFSSIANVVGLAISSKAKMWIGFGFNLVWGIMTITFTYIFINMGYGAIGLAFAFCLAYIIHSSLQLIYLKSAEKKYIAE